MTEKVTISPDEAPKLETVSYREGFYNLVWAVKILSAGIFVMVGVLLYYITSVVPQDRYYALTGVDGKTRVQMLGLYEPNITDEALMSWVTQAATDIMTFGFNDIEERFALSRGYFTDEGWRSFSEAMGKSEFLKTLSSAQQIITTIPRAPPQQVFRGFYKGQYTWIIEVPLLMTIRAGARSKQHRTSVRLFIVRMPTQNNPMGIGINTWRA